jgi:hypothetical protein
MAQVEIVMMKASSRGVEALSRWRITMTTEELIIQIFYCVDNAMPKTEKVP